MKKYILSFVVCVGVLLCGSLPVVANTTTVYVAWNSSVDGPGTA